MIFISTEEQLMELVMLLKDSGPNWDVVVAVTTFILGFVISGVTTALTNLKRKRIALADNLWVLFFLIQRMYQKVWYFRIALVHQIQKENIDESFKSSFPLTEFYNDLWDKFALFDSMIGKKDRKKETYTDINRSVINILEALMETHMSILMNESNQQILGRITTVEDEMRGFIDRYNEQITKIKLKSN